MASPKLYKLGKLTFLVISRMKNLSDLNLGEGLVIFTFFHFPDSGFYLLNGFEFLIFDCVTVKTSNA